MKKSNIIILAVSTFLLLITLALFILAKVYRAGDTDYTTYGKTEKFNGKFSTIVINNSSNVSIVIDSTLTEGNAKVEFTIFRDSTLKKDAYKFSNDTLYIQTTDLVNIFTKDRLEIKSRESTIKLHGMPLDSLNADIINSQVQLSSDIHINDMELNIENSKVEIFQGKFRNVSLSLKNEAIVNFYNQPQIDDLKYSKDSTSMVFIR